MRTPDLNSPWFTPSLPAAIRPVIFSLVDEYVTPPKLVCPAVAAATRELLQWHHILTVSGKARRQRGAHYPPHSPADIIPVRCNRVALFDILLLRDTIQVTITGTEIS